MPKTALRVRGGALALPASNACLNGTRDRRGRSSHDKTHTAERDSRKAKCHSRSREFFGASTSSAQSILQTLEPRPPHRRNNSRSTRLRVFSLLSPLRPTRPLSRANIGKGRCGDLAPSPAIDRDNFLSPGLRPPSPLGSRDTGATGRRDRSAHSIVAGSFECRDCPVETLDLVREPVTFSLKLVEYRGDIGHGAL